MLTLEEYRIQVVERLKGLREPVRVTGVLLEVELFLAHSAISSETQRSFWDKLYNDLDVVTQDSTLLLGKQAATELRAVVAAAQTEIAQYRLMLGSEEGTRR
jgi:hypothetical protein